MGKRRNWGLFLLAKNKIARNNFRVKKISKSRGKLGKARGRGSSGLSRNRKSNNNSELSLRNIKFRNQNQIIVRIMGKGQFRINRRTAKRINALDNSIVDIVKGIIAQEKEFKKKLKEMHSLVSKDGKVLEDTEIIKSDILLPNNDISIHDAKGLFRGGGIVPD
jgi:hypothetical protein